MNNFPFLGIPQFIDTPKFCWHMSNEKYPGCLGFVGDYTTQLYRDYNKPIYKDAY